jgi:hypothetical protein
MSDLDNDFEETAKKINAKLKEAAEALREANRLSDEEGLPGLIYTQFTRDDLGANNRRMDADKKAELEKHLDEIEEKLEKIDVGELEAALGDAGWSTSSSYC